MRLPFLSVQNLLARIFASLICNTAGGLASGLARGLALAAAAGLNGLGEITGLDGDDSLHIEKISFNYDILLTVYPISSPLSSTHGRVFRRGYPPPPAKPCRSAEQRRAGGRIANGSSLHKEFTPSRRKSSDLFRFY